MTNLKGVSKIIEIYTDGSAGPTNPGPGAFGVVVVDKRKDDEQDNIINVYQYVEDGDTTNNRMEMKAIIWALKHYGVKLSDSIFTIPPTVYSDSSYAVNTFTDWIFGWRNKGWRKANNQEPENMDLLKEFIDLYDDGLRIDLRKVKGHAGNKYNEIADKIASRKVKYSVEINGKEIWFDSNITKTVEIQKPIEL